MSAGVSTVPAVLARLKVIFETAVEEPTQVWGNRPNEDYALSENVFIGDVRGEREFRNVGGVTPHQREEEYSVGFEVEVFREGTDGEGTEARMWEIVLLIEKGIAEDPGLGLEQLLKSGIVGRFQTSAVGSNDGWKCTYLGEVKVEARV